MGGSPTLSLSGCRKKDSSQATGKQSILPQQASGYHECASAGIAASIAATKSNAIRIDRARSASRGPGADVFKPASYASMLVDGFLIRRSLLLHEFRELIEVL